MACQNNSCCSPSYRNLRWVSVYTWDDTSHHSNPEWSADHWSSDLPIFDPDISANFTALSWDSRKILYRGSFDPPPPPPVNPFSTRPHQNAFWYNYSCLGFLKCFVKIINYLYIPEERETFSAIKKKKLALICHRLMLRWLIGIILGKIICESSNLATYTKIDHYSRCKLATF